MDHDNGKTSSFRNVKIGTSPIFLVGSMAISANKELNAGSSEENVLRFAEELNEWLNKPWFLVEPNKIKVLRFALSKIDQDHALPGIVVDRSKEIVRLLCKSVEGDMPSIERENLVKFCSGFHEAAERLRVEHAF